MSSKTQRVARAPRSEHLESLARGLRVLELFGAGDAHELAMIEVAERLSITRASAMRVLGTLERLGFVRRAGRHYAPTPRVLGLGYAYLASLGFAAIAKPIVDALMHDTGETCSIGVLDGRDVVYVARAEARRLVRIDLNVGSRLPAYLNSMGRVLLSALPDQDLNAYLAALKPVAVTSKTLTDKRELKRRIVAIRRTGWCYIDGEVEESIAGLATPIRDRHGATIAALNLALAFSRHGRREIETRYLPKLRASTRAIEDILRNDVAVDVPSR
ncbi:MAG TPA: IclR family transcriptional regulator C-terminal domain-containing protein [Casimicrobiaceae bacterium]|nr:IclR family transcriptional regulator C-terminal domain-containing protein [Casimicrobiaceae bacterium]